MMLRQLNNQHKGGEKASREFPKCHSKNNEKKGNIEKIQLERKPFSWRKHLSLGTVYVLHGISAILKNRLKIGTSGDITTNYLICCFHKVFAVYINFFRMLYACIPSFF